MKRVSYSLSKAWLIVLIAASLSSFGLPPARAGLTFSYSGTITSFQNEGDYDIWGQTVLGSPITGTFAYDASASPDIIDPTFRRWITPITPHGVAQFNIAGPTFQFTAPSMQMSVYKVAGDAIQLGGSQFDYQGREVELFPLPANTTLLTNGFVLNFLTRNLALTTFPSPPTEFLPLSQWDLEDPAGANGLVFTVFQDTAGVVHTGMAHFRLDQVTAVPEPTSAILLIAALGWAVLFNPWPQARRTR